MSCEELSEELSAYLDGELSSQQRSRLEAHLQRCTRCREELGSLRAVSRLVASLPAVEPSEAFVQALSRKISARRPRRWLRPIPTFAGDLVPALAVAALLLVAVTVTFVIPALTSPGREAERYQAAPKPSAELADEIAASYEAPAGGPPTEEPARAKLAPRDDKSEASEDLVLVAKQAGREAPAVAPEPPALTDKALAERAERLEMTNIARGTAVTSALPPERVGGDVDAEGMPLRGVLAEGESTEGMAQSAPVMSSAAKVAEKERAAMFGEAGEAGRRGRVGGLDMERGSGAAALPGFYAVVLHSSDSGGGRGAFDKALGEFDALKTPTPGVARARQMSREELEHYSRVIRDALTSPDVLAHKELVVPASDVGLIQAVFADSADLSFADPNTDVDKLRRVLTSARRRPAVSGEALREAPSRSLGVRESRRDARGRAVIPEHDVPAHELVHVVVVLKRPSAPLRRAAPTLDRTPGRRGL